MGLTYKDSGVDKEKGYEENYRDIYEEQKKKSDEDFYWEEVQKGPLF